MFKIITFITGIWKWIQNLINEYVIKPLITFYDFLVNGFKGVLQIIWILPTSFKAFIDAIVTKFTQVINLISSKISDVKNWVNSNVVPAINNVINTIKSDLQKAWNKLNLIKDSYLQWLNDKFNFIQYFIENLFSNTKVLIEKYFKNIVDFFDNLYDRTTAVIEKWLEQGFLKILDKIGEFINEVW